ncbi:MAG: hypothetical protein WAM58_08575 [Candidatus Acidiferrum sp.]
MGTRPIWIPDTSAVNALADDPDSESFIAGLRSGYFVRFPFTVVSEVIANSSGERRRQLLRLCRRLLSSAGNCIEPHHEILRVMVARFEKSLTLDLGHVNLRMTEAESEIMRAEDFDDALATQEREEGRTCDKTFTSVYSDAKPAFDEIASRGERMPESVQELIICLQRGGAFWKLAQNLYNRVASKPADDGTIQRFYSLTVRALPGIGGRCFRGSI